MTVAVSCVQSAISLEAETPAFFFSAWSKHVLTASHSILKHLQLGADEDIKKTHPKHLRQPAVKNLLLSPALPYCRGSSSSLFWLHNKSARDYTHSIRTRSEPWRVHVQLLRPLTQTTVAPSVPLPPAVWIPAREHSTQVTPPHAFLTKTFPRWHTCAL